MTDWAIIRATDGSPEKAVELHPSMTAESLRRRLTEAGWTEEREVFVTVAEERLTSVLDLLRQIVPNAVYRETSLLEPGERMRGSAVYTVTIDYFRAIAKIAFHHFLLWQRVFRGHETHFDDLRRFILTGESLGENVAPVPEWNGGLYEARQPTAHLIYVRGTDEGLLAFVHLFAGDETITRPHMVRLSPDKALASAYAVGRGHAYVYAEVIVRGKPYAGVLRKIGARA